MSVIDLLLFLALQPVVSPTYPWPLPPRLSSPEELSIPSELPEGPELPFFPEKLEFSVHWGIVRAGVATMELSGVERLASPSPFNGGPRRARTVYKAVTTATSKGLTNAVYPVHDLNESWIDTRTLSSLAFMKKLREGTFWRDEWYRYFPDINRWVGEQRNRQGGRESKQGVIPDGVQDVLSAVYWVRRQKLEVGRDLVVDVNTGENWPLLVKVLRRETIEVPAGRFECFVVEPTLRAEGLFIQKGKKLTLWLTADERHMPVRMEVEVFIGHISAKLEKYSRG